jgi:hypothetical protein
VHLTAVQPLPLASHWLAVLNGRPQVNVLFTALFQKKPKKKQILAGPGMFMSVSSELAEWA